MKLQVVTFTDDNELVQNFTSTIDSQLGELNSHGAHRISISLFYLRKCDSD
jgi:hypothetical protein